MKKGGQDFFLFHLRSINRLEKWQEVEKTSTQKALSVAEDTLEQALMVPTKMQSSIQQMIVSEPLQGSACAELNITWVCS